MRPPAGFRHFIGTAAALFLILAPGLSRAQPQTLCILDLNRLSENNNHDWLRRGVADMLTTTLNATSEFQIVDRSHLTKLIEANNLNSSGLTDDKGALGLARLTKAQLLLLGNFTLDKDQLTVELRLIETGTQRVASTAQWTGALSTLNSGIRELSAQLLRNNGSPVDPARWVGMEKYIPQHIDTAETYYRGLNEFDAGRYPEALAFFNDGTRINEVFLPIFDRLIEMYHLLDEPAQGMAAALQTAEKLEKKELGSAMNYYFQACDKAGRSESLMPVRHRILERMISLADAHEAQTREASGTKELVSGKIFTNYERKRNERGQLWMPIWHWDVLRDDEIFYRMWIQNIEDQLNHRYQQGGYNMTRDEQGNYVQKPVRPLSVWMWKTRAQFQLAGLLASANEFERAIKVYHDVMNDYSFMEDLVRRAQAVKKEGFSLRSDLYAKAMQAAQGLILRSATKTGRLKPDSLVFPKLHIIKDNETFRRDFNEALPDPRTDLWGSDSQGFWEEFSFAAPEGRRITRLRFKGKVNGAAEMYVNGLTVGSHPGSDRELPYINVLKSKAIHDDIIRELTFAPATFFATINIYAGPRYLETPMDSLRYAMKSPGDPREVISWEAQFETAPMEPTAPAAVPTDYSSFDAKVLEDWVNQYGWERANVIHYDQHTPFNNTPPVDVYATDWLVFDDGRDIMLILKSDPTVRVALPVSINSNDEEYNPTLVKAGDGSLALIWSRADRDTKMTSGYFVSFTRDMIEWQPPQKLSFERTPEGFGKQALWCAYSADHCADWPGTHEQSYNIFPVDDGYLMLMGPGYVRRSADLVHWSLPEKLLKLEGMGNYSTISRHEGKSMGYDGNWDSVTKTDDGRTWIVSPFTEREELSAATAFLPQWRKWPDRATGKTYVSTHFIKVVTTIDGRTWSKDILIPLDKYTKDINGLWAFPVSRSQIGIFLISGGRELKGALMLTPEKYQIIPVNVAMFPHNRDKAFYLDNSELVCAYPLPHHEKINENEPGMLLINRSRSMHGTIKQHLDH